MLRALLSYGNGGLVCLEANSGLKIWLILERLLYLTCKSNTFVKYLLITISMIQGQAVVSGS